MVGAADFLKNVDAGSTALQGAAGSGAAGLVKRAAQAACDAARTNVSDAILNPAGKAFAEGLCGDYWASTGTAPTTGLPFVGGQCSGVNYYVTAQLAFKNLSTGVTGTPALIRSAINNNRSVPGPVLGVFVLNQFPTQSRIVWRGTGNQGDMLNASNNSIVFNPQQQQAIISGVTVSPVDAQCGNPDPTFTPGTGPTINYGDTINYDVGGGITIPIVPIVPIVKIDGTVSIPVDVGGVTLEFGSSSGDGASLNPNVGPDITASEPSAGLIGDNEFGSPPEGHQWVGFQVVLADQGVTNGLYPNSEPDAVYRAAAGVARAIYSIGGNRVLGTAFPLNGETTTRLLELPGLTLVGCRVSIPSNDVYTVIKLSQPIEE